MAETQAATVGYMGQFHLHNGTALYKLRKVTGFDIPTPGTREEEEVTDLESPGWRREYVSTFYEDSEFTVSLNTRLLSDTDVLVADALSDGDVRAFKAVIPENGVPVAQVTGTCKCTGYERGRVEPDSPIEATVTFRVVTIDAVAAYSA
jgi:hypothetical protein